MSVEGFLCIARVSSVHRIWMLKKRNKLLSSTLSNWMPPSEQHLLKCWLSSLGSIRYKYRVFNVQARFYCLFVCRDVNKFGVFDKFHPVVRRLNLYLFIYLFIHFSFIYLFIY